MLKVVEENHEVIIFEILNLLSSIEEKLTKIDRRLESIDVEVTNLSDSVNE